jgi:peptide/nickel transport system ATP-binding protein
MNNTVKTETPLLEVKNLSKFFPIYSEGLRKKVTGHVKAANNISFNLYRNETLGMVGESGCGKTTAVRAILRAIDPTSGSAVFRDKDMECDLAQLKHRELKAMRPHMQMVFQDPFASLNPRMTVSDIISEPLVIHRMCRKSELNDKVDEILLKVGLKPNHKVRYPHAFSGGQRQRIGIARALIMNPSLVVADEAVSALDVSVQAQVINLLADMKTEMNLSMIFVAHDLSVVKHICDRVAVMYLGRIVELAKTEDLFDKPLHPYTRLLLSAVPNPDPDVKMNFDTGGEVADAGKDYKGCPFAERCSEFKNSCNEKLPDLQEVEPGHFVACDCLK